MIKPPSLKKGDTIRIIATGSPFDKEAFLEGVGVLKNTGFNVVYDDSIFLRIPYLAGSDKQRANNLINALTEDSSQAILFARGGYGSMRLLPFLDSKLKDISPKLIVGYSDMTCLLNYLYQRFDLVTCYGPVVAKDINLKDNKTTNDLIDILTGKIPTPKTDSLITINKGCSTAPLTGGCLSLITSLLGTKYEINTNNKILFLEDVNEKPYEIDRLLTHLKLAGKFNNCQGVLFGTLSGPNPSEHYQETIHDVLKDFDFPILYNYPAGHCSPKTSLPLGIKTTLDATNKTVTFNESFTE